MESISSFNMTNSLKALKKLVNQKGYFYSLLMILFEDFHIDVLELQNLNPYERVSVKEASLLLGYWVQNNNSLYDIPESLEQLLYMKKQTYELLQNLHFAMSAPCVESIKQNIDRPENGRIEDVKEIFGKAASMREPIFYSGDSVYDYEYMKFLNAKYKYDTQWLKDNKDFTVEEVKNILFKIKQILSDKSQIVDFVSLQKVKDLILKTKKGKTKEDEIDQFVDVMNLYQYRNLLDIKCYYQNEFEKEKVLDEFCSNLLSLFVIDKNDLIEYKGLDSFFRNFSFEITPACNQQFLGPGQQNIFQWSPIIKLSDDVFFIPLPYLLFESVYETPYYWLISDDSYKKKAGSHKGDAGEDMVYDLLLPIFNENRIFKNVLIKTSKKDTKTDIDVLCILGNKALCIQIKSKKLTELAKSGDDDSLQKDFKGAVQDAYNQGLLSRDMILSKSAKFMLKDGTELHFTEQVDEVYLLCITTENYPALTHQVHILLDRDVNKPAPVVFSVFDLHLVSFYLKDPYDFMYYIRQRVATVDYYVTGEEINYLGHHLLNKLWIDKKYRFCMLDNSYASAIDRNFYSCIADIKVSDQGDKIKKRWINTEFEKLCNEIKMCKEPQVTDIIFNLLDLNGNTINDLIKSIHIVKEKSFNKKNNVSATLFFNEEDCGFGITYVSCYTHNPRILYKELFSQCEINKYQAKANKWIGLASCADSTNLVDMILYDFANWTYDAVVEAIALEYSQKNIKRKVVTFDKKISRNDPCPCGSGLKFKKCHGK
jgi:Predicted metal-binding protein related to the C-terminal domain of SecA